MSSPPPGFVRSSTKATIDGVDEVPDFAPRLKGGDDAGIYDAAAAWFTEQGWTVTRETPPRETTEPRSTAPEQSASTTNFPPHTPQRRSCTRPDTLNVLEQRLLAFQDRYNGTAIPFDWRFGRAALHTLLERVDRHEAAAA